MIVPVTSRLPAPSQRPPSGNLVKTVTSLSMDPATCTPQLINDTRDAYAAFLNTQPDIVPETVEVTVTCTQVVRSGVRRRHWQIQGRMLGKEEVRLLLCLATVAAPTSALRNLARCQIVSSSLGGPNKGISCLGSAGIQAHACKFNPPRPHLHVRCCCLMMTGHRREPDHHGQLPGQRRRWRQHSQPLCHVLPLLWHRRLRRHALRLARAQALQHHGRPGPSRHIG